jgi:hypothetical protein
MPMGLTDRVNDDLKASMKARDEFRLSVVRMLKAAVKNREIEKMGALSDDDVIAVVSSMIKQRRDSSEQYLKAGRGDLAQKEEAEIKVLEGYLPEQLSEEELVKIIREAISEAVAGAVAPSPNDMGKVMKLLMPRVKGRADGKLVNQKVKELLGG